MILHKIDLSKVKGIDGQAVMTLIGATLVVLGMIAFLVYAFVGINSIWEIYTIPGFKIVGTTIIVQIVLIACGGILLTIADT